jgi:hypothetical protein
MPERIAGPSAAVKALRPIPSCALFPRCGKEAEQTVIHKGKALCYNRKEINRIFLFTAFPARGKQPD